MRRIDLRGNMLLLKHHTETGRAMSHAETRKVACVHDSCEVVYFLLDIDYLE